MTYQGMSLCCIYLPTKEVAKLKTKSKPNDLRSTLGKVAEIQRERNGFKRRDMFVNFLGSNGLNLIDESKHQQPKKRYLP